MASRVAVGSVFGAIAFGHRRAEAAHLIRAWPSEKGTPALELSDLDGKAWRLASWSGQVVVLNFWATWCEPCRAEMPSLAALQEQHRKSGLVVVSVNYRESVATIRRFIESLQTAVPVLLDPDGAAAAVWTPRVFPTTVLIDRNGVARQSVLGDLDWNGPIAKQLLEPLLAAKAPTARLRERETAGGARRRDAAARERQARGE